jgi:hypothetical protein
LSGDVRFEDEGISDFSSDQRHDYHGSGGSIALREDPSPESLRVIEPQPSRLNAGQVEPSLSPETSDSFSSQNFVQWSTPGLLSPTSDFHAPSAGTHQTTYPSTSIPRYSQPITSSPASTTPQLSCDFCRALFPTSKSLCTHIVAQHVPSAPFRCGRNACQTFKEERSLERHLRTKHLCTKYVCRCGHTVGRKDKHRDHLSLNACVGDGNYRCICGLHDAPEIDSHRAHIDQCGVGKKGRPKKKILERRG